MGVEGMVRGWGGGSEANQHYCTNVVPSDSEG